MFWKKKQSLICPNNVQHPVVFLWHLKVSEVTLHYPGSHGRQNESVFAWISLNPRQFSVSKVLEAYSDTKRETIRESDVVAMEDRDL